MKCPRHNFPCGEITLEGELQLPRGKVPFPGVVVCHPHPLYGGDMWNNVVTAICQALTDNFIVAFRFNFRGVGQSEGDFDGGVGEQEDVRAALAFLRSRPAIDSSRIGLAGYSFGAGVALPVAVGDKEVNHLALVSPSLVAEAWVLLKDYPQPKFIMVGDNDFVLPVEHFQSHIAEIPEPKQCHVISGADHFWAGHEADMADKVAAFFADGQAGV